MLNNKNVSIVLSAMVFISGVVANSASAAPLTAQKQTSVAKVLAASIRTQASLESSAAAIKSAASYNSGSLTELKVMDVVQRVAMTFDQVKAVATDGVKAFIMNYMKSIFGIDLNQDTYITNKQKFELTVQLVDGMIKMQKNIQTLAQEALSTNDDKNLVQLDAQLTDAEVVMTKMDASLKDLLL
jgi:hypothetical protein